MKNLGLHQKKSNVGPALAHTTFASDINPEDTVLIYCRRDNTSNNGVVTAVRRQWRQGRRARTTNSMNARLSMEHSLPVCRDAEEVRKDEDEDSDEEHEETMWGTLLMGCPPGSMLGIFVNPMDGALWGATSTGELYCLASTGSGDCPPLGEMIGCIPSGIQAWCPRPDGEMLALVTGEGRLVLLETSSWSVLWERSLEEILNTAVKAEGAGASVGWGRKETQFHGKAGKAAALTRETIQETLLATDDGLPRLSWRPDGEFLACSFVHRLWQPQQTEDEPAERNISASRKLLIVSPNDPADTSAAVAIVGEPIEGLGMAMAWRGDGSLIAVHQQRAPHEHWIVFYERNGLRHGEFRLSHLPTTTDATVIKALTWNCDGSILAIHHYQRQESTEMTKDESMIDLWTTSNYHWYLKYRLPREPIEEVSWSVNNPYTLLTRGQDLDTGEGRGEGGVVKEYTFFETVHRSSCIGRDDPLSLVAVIDGSRLLLTALALANVPPPFSQTVIELEGCCWVPSWISIVVGGGEDDFILLAASCQGHLVAYRIERGSGEAVTMASSSNRGRPPTLKVTLLWSLSLGLGIKQVVATKGARTIYGLTMGGRGLFCLDGTSRRLVHLSLSASPLTLFTGGPGSIVGAGAGEGYRAYVQTRLGDIIPLPGIRDREMMSLFDDNMPSTAASLTLTLELELELELIRAGGDDDYCTAFPSPLIATKDGQTFFHLDNEQKGQLSYFTVDGAKGTLATNCTSFMLLDDFVCWTDPAGLLRFHPLFRLSLAQEGRERGQPYTPSPGRTEEAERLTEGGARLIVAIPKAASLVLQMPRGNLETIYPRALLLSLVKRLLDGLHYREAFLTCRRHHLDMNLLHDHNVALFRSTLGKFLEALPEAEHLNYFLTSLRNINVMHTRYAPLGARARLDDERSMTGPPTGIKAVTDDPFANKVNELCEAFRGEFLRSEISRHRFVEPLMTTFVVQQPPDYEAALQIIISLQGESTVMERALKYLLFLVPAERLYRTALGLYNLPMALSVARRSTLDPAEYTGFLNDLHRCQPLPRQRHRIDDYLQRHEQALQHLLQCEDASWEGEVLPYIQRHTLYKVAFEILPDLDATHWPSLCTAYGEYEEGRGNVFMAADLFAHAGDRAHALDLAITAGYWQKVLALSAEEEQIVRLVDILRQGRRHDEAFALAVRHLKDPSLLTEIAIEGRLWTTGSVSIVGDVALKQVLVTGALQCREQILVEVKQLMADLTEKFERLEKVQAQLVSELDPSHIRAALEGGEPSPSSSSLSEAGGGGDPLSERLSTLSMRTGTSLLSTLSGASTLASISRASTSKNKRKADKQRMRGKPGSPFEREYLRDTLRELITKAGALCGGEGVKDLLQFLADERQFVAARSLQQALLDLCSLLEDHCARLQRLVQAQEERMNPELFSLLGLTSWSVPTTLQVDHVWKMAFDIPPRLRSFIIAYL